MSKINSNTNPTLWDSIPEYQRRNPDSVRPPSERIDPDVPGSYFWVIVVTNWDNMHPLVQDVLFTWYRAISKSKGDDTHELDPTSTEALVHRLEELDGKLRSFDLERSNLEEELTIRDRDFKRLRGITGKREKENIEVQQLLGQTFQEKIMAKQNEIDEKDDLIKHLEAQVLEMKNQLDSGATIPEPISSPSSNEEMNNLLAKLAEKDAIIAELQNMIQQKEDKIKEIRSLLQG
ncbi:MAG: hypothetical protein ACTSXA_14740 [Candidatus Heimdallarchaeota archaeon]